MRESRSSSTSRTWMSSGARLLSCFRDAVDGFGGHATASATSSTRGDAISRETLHNVVSDALKATSAVEQSESPDI